MTSSLPRPLTETHQANAALAHIGEPAIADLGDVKRKAARECKRHFADVRDSLLRAENWQFARAKFSGLTATFDPKAGYAYRFLLPSDCLQVRELVGATDGEAWETSTPSDAAANLVLDTVRSAPVGWYTRRVDNPAVWDPLFGDVFQLLLAAKVNPNVGRDKALTDMLLKRAQDALDKSAVRDAQTRSSQQVSTDTSWVRSRGYGGPRVWNWR